MQSPTPFWDSPAFTTAAVLLMGALYSGIQLWVKSKQDDMAKKVEKIETHTNGMLSALQGKVDAAELARINQEQLTQKDIKIAELTPVPPDAKK